VQHGRSKSAEVSGQASWVVLTCGELPDRALEALFAPWEVEVMLVGDGEPIPGSYWGEPEAGIVGARLFLRRDTPVHSALHEGCHLVCMDAERRRRIDRDAGGDELEESAVCYLQLLLAARLPGASAERLCADMDAWGYSFRAGSTRCWFENDAEDARAWLQRQGILDRAAAAVATMPLSCASS
jgi:hypothetical protein